MTLEEFKWTPEPLDQQDQAIVEAYLKIGVPLDSLAYTKEFKRLVKAAGLNENNDAELGRVYRRLLTLRKQARLPRSYSSSSSSTQ